MIETRLEEQELDRLAAELFRNHESQFIPRRPWVLVRVLPREHYYMNRILLPNTKSQNKPVHEGIVLQTWEPYTTQKTRHHNNYDFGVGVICIDDVVTVHTSEFVAGDHVCYPHWAGQPIPGWDERYYLCVPEQVNEDVGIDASRCILGKLNYPKESVSDQLALIMARAILIEDKPLETITATILEQFDVIPKNQSGKTTSGK